MNTAPPPSPSARPLAPGALHSLHIHRKGLQLTVSQGRLWVTLHGMPDDHFLSAGQSLTVPRGARVLMQCDSTEPAHWALAAHCPPAPSAPRVADNRAHEHTRIAAQQPPFAHPGPRPQLR